MALNDGRQWITYDPLSHRTEISVLAVPASFDLAAWYRARGLTVVPATIRVEELRPAPWMPFTCVEAVKRVLGLRSRSVLTPWQLYRRLAREPFTET